MGYNSRLDELQAAILRVKLRHLEEWTAGRRRVAASYNELLAGLPVATPYEAPRMRHVYHQYTIRAPRRDKLRAFLNDQGIGTMIYYPLPLHLQVDRLGPFLIGLDQVGHIHRVVADDMILTVNNHLRGIDRPAMPGSGIGMLALSVFPVAEHVLQPI